MADSIKRLARCKHHLHVLKSSPSAVQKVLIQKADRDLILSIAEIARNILNGNLRLTPQSRENLRRFKTTIRRLAAPVKKVDRSRSHRKNPSKQRGRGGGGGGCSTHAGARFHDCNGDEWKKKRRYLVQVGTGAFLTSLLTTALGAAVGRLISTGVSKWQSSNHDTVAGAR